MNNLIVTDTGRDANLLAEFYEGSRENRFQSEKQGRPIFDPVDMVRITVPGVGGLTVEHEVTEEHKNRFPNHWLRFKNQKEGRETQASGTPLVFFPLLRPHMIRELEGLGFHTVEMVANASDSQISQIGMAVGMSAHVFRDKAKAFLIAASSTAAVVKQDEEVTQLREQLNALQAQMAQLLVTEQGVPTPSLDKAEPVVNGVVPTTRRKPLPQP